MECACTGTSHIERTFKKQRSYVHERDREVVLLEQLHCVRQERLNHHCRVCGYGSSLPCSRASPSCCGLDGQQHSSAYVRETPRCAGTPLRSESTAHKSVVHRSAAAGLAGDPDRPARGAQQGRIRRPRSGSFLHEQALASQDNLMNG